MEKLAGLRANKHNNRQVDKQSAGVMSCVGSDEGTYFRPACGLGNDKSGTQKENEGCQTKQNPHPDASLLPERSFPHPLKVHSGQSCGCADSSQWFVRQLAPCPPAINSRIGCVPLNQRDSTKQGQFVPLMAAKKLTRSINQWVITVTTRTSHTKTTSS